MDQRMEKLERLQKEMQDLLQVQMKEHMEKIQKDMAQKMKESQDDLMTKLTQLIAKGAGKGKSPVICDEEGNNDEPLFPPGFTPPQAQIQIEPHPRRPSVSIRPQHSQGDASIPKNLQVGSDSSPGNNQVVPDFDEVAEKDKMKEELPKQFEEKWKWIEEKFRAIESIGSYRGIDAKDLSLVPDLVLPYKFKMPEFEKYNGTSCPEAHITMFCWRMTGYINNDQLLILCFQDSLIGAALKWYNQLSRTKIATWRDLAQAFMRQYNHVSEMMPDRITLQNLEKKSSESFRQYAQRWREVAVQNFSDIIMSGEMIEHAIKSGRIDGGENNKRIAPRKRENEVNNVNAYSKSITVSQPRKAVINQQGSSKQESGMRQNTEKPQFTPIPMTYNELYQNLFNAHVVAPRYLSPLQPPYPKWYDTNAQCDYHAGISGHSIENCTAFKKVVEGLIKLGVVKFGDSPNTESPLPNHEEGANAIIENGGRRVKANVAEIRTPIEWVWKQMVKGGCIKQDLIERPKGASKFCEFHAEEGHDIQKCTEFRTMVQNLMDNKELEFYEEINGLEEGEVYAAEEGSTGKAQKANHPVVIISKPMSRESGIQTAPKVIIQNPVSFPYEDSKKVPWNYDCNVTIPGKESLVNASGEDEGFYTRSGKRYDPPVTENEAREFLKFLKHSEYSVVEQLHKQPARISVLELLISSEIQCNALIKVLNETYVAHDISVNKLDRLVNNISADNFIFFNDDEIPPRGRGATKALHITARCGEYALAGVLIDNGSALNVLPLSTLNRLPVDSSHMKSCQNIVRAFDGTKRKVMGRIEIPLLIGPNTYEVDFLVIDIKPSYNCLLGRPWIHSAGAVPSLLHQKLKLVTEGRLITIDAEEDIIASVTSDAPYLGTDDEAVECSFRSLEFVNATSVIEGKKISMPSISRATRMGLQMTVGKGAMLGRGLGRCLQGRIEAPVLKDKQDRFGLGFKPNAKQRRKELEKRQERRKARVNGKEVDWEPMAFPHISKTFVSGGTMYSGLRTPRREITEEMVGNLNINAISEEKSEEGSTSGIYPVEPGSEEKQIIPHKETVETMTLEEGKMVKIGTCIAEEIKQDLIELLREFKDVFAWSYQDMPGLSTDIVVHRLPIKEDCKPVQQKLRRMRPDVKAVKGSATADFLASRALEDYEPLDFDFPNEDLMYVATIEKDFQESGPWKLNFDGASNAIGNRIGAVLVSPSEDHYPFTSKLDFDSIDYVLDGDILYKRGKDQVLLRCVDAVEAKEILEEVHEGICGTHANGFTMARQIMRFGYYWSTMEGDCINYAKKCHKCQIYGDKMHAPPSPLHVMVSPWPFSMWGMDVIGPISPKASNGHRFIFVVIDYFTKWVEAASYANVTKSAVNKFLKKEIICRYGMPERIISDNALNLNNNSIAKVCSQFKIRHHNSSPYRPKMNGAVEAANKNIKKIVGKMTETYKDWHEKLPFALLAYRTSVRTSTGATPFSLVYGMEAVLPLEVEIPSLRVLAELKLDEAEWIQSQYDQLNLVEEKRLKAIRHGQMYQKRMMRAYNKKVRPREFYEGDLVLKKILPLQKDFRGKWMPNWEGPYVVKKAFSGGALILSEMDGKSLSNPVNSDSVKKYFT
nr:unnamed protein product [Gossypium raimondii]